MGEKKKIASRDDVIRGTGGAKKKIISICLDPDVIDWINEWTRRRDRSVSWAINYLIKERRNKEWAERNFVEKKVLNKGPKNDNSTK